MNALKTLKQRINHYSLPSFWQNLYAYLLDQIDWFFFCTAEKIRNHRRNFVFRIDARRGK